MNLFYVCLLVSLPLCEANIDNTTSRLINLLNKLCPATDVCRDNQTKYTSAKSFKQGLESCCSECYCRSDCHEKENCCFQHLDSGKKQLDDMSTETRSVCLFPSTLQPSIEDRKFYISYNMISSVTVTSVGETCGNEKVAPWGSLYPIYSASRKQIYKNSACAEADGVVDAKVWDALLVCVEDHTDIELKADSFIQGLNSYSISNSCKIYFKYQGHSEDIEPLKCYIDLLDTCNATDFNIPASIDASKEEVIDACTSGLVSPYTQTKLYANAFCHICNDEVFHQNVMCIKLDPSARGNAHKGFIGLLDSSFIQAVRKKHFTEGQIHVYPRACPKQSNRGCRTIYCPSVQLRVQGGRCLHPNKLWYDQVYSVTINVSTGDDIDVIDLFQVAHGGSSLTLPDLKSPWPKNWFIDTVHYDDSGKHANTNDILVVLKNKIGAVRPSQLVQSIQETVRRDWLLNYNNITFVLKSRVSKFRRSIIYRRGESIIDIGNRSEIIYKPIYREVYFSLESTANIHEITKLYWCDQIELLGYEYILSDDQEILFNTITRKFMTSGEFTLMKTSTFDGIRARVCIEDSGLYRTGNEDFSNGCGFGTFCSVLLELAALLIWSLS